MGLQIYANIDATSLATARVQSANDLRPKAFKPLAAGDSTVVDLFLTGQNGLENIQDYPTVRLGIGSLNARPTGGTWDLGSETNLAYNISAVDLKNAIDAEVDLCSVTELTPFVFKVVFNITGAQTIPAVDASALTPSSSVSIKKLVEGDGSTQEQWLIRIFRNPVALIDSAFTNIAGSGIRGSLNLGTAEVYDLLASASSVDSTIELELTDSNGDVQTIFQVPITITGEVIGDGATGVATFGSYVTSAESIAGFTKDNTIFVSKNGSDSSGTRGRFDLPFLTCNAAEDAASSGDTIIVFPGDYSGEAALSGVDGVNWRFIKGAVSPDFNVNGASFEVYGDIGGFLNTRSSTISVWGNVGEYTRGTSGSVINLYGSIISHDGTTYAPIQCEQSSQILLSGCRVESTESGGTVADIATSWSGSLIAKNCDFVNTTVATNEATNGIEYGTSVTGDVQLKDCTIITAENGTGTAKSIDAPSAQTVYIQGTLNQTHVEDADITFAGGSTITNTNFTA